MLDTEHSAATDETASGSETIAAELFLSGLTQSGVDYLFANAGTDFPSIIEALARAPETGAKFPEALVIPHETVAVGMAHGYYLATGRPQAVMVHVNVGLANAAMGVINAAADNAAVLVCSGRTPVTEKGRIGSKSSPIHWGQEMRDQGALVRESVKWEHELRYPEQAGEMVARGLSIAQSDPPGPVYLSLPREVLAEPVPAEALKVPAFAASRMGAAPSVSIEEAAALIAAAKNPIVITQGLSDPAEVEALASLSERFGLAVSEFFATKFALPTSHPANVGRNPAAWLAKADVIVVLQSLVPWVPNQQPIAEGAKIIAIGPDPLHCNVPVRTFPVEVSLTGQVSDTLWALTATLERRVVEGRDVVARLEEFASYQRNEQQALKARVDAARTSPMGPAWVSHCISQAKPADAMVFNELGCDVSFMTFEIPRSYFATPLSGGLGWGLPAALGAQLACRDRQVIACVGDGSYMFANPMACHQVARALNLPLLTVVMNNGIWNAVRRSTLTMYPDGTSAAAEMMPLTSLAPSPDYCLIAQAYGAHAERVERWEDLPAALERALAETRTGHQALLEVIVGY
jgi:acetolactate synthase-1/2/3 large subunit